MAEGWGVEVPQPSSWQGHGAWDQRAIRELRGDRQQTGGLEPVTRMEQGLQGQEIKAASSGNSFTGVCGEAVTRGQQTPFIFFLF